MTESTRAPWHTVTVTKIEDDESDDIEYSTTCNGVGCSYWEECGICSPFPPTHGPDYQPSDEERDEGEYHRHGREHQLVDGDWMTETGHCALTHTESGTDSIWEIARKHGLGTHNVDVNYWGDSIWEVDYVEPGVMPRGWAA